MSRGCNRLWNDVPQYAADPTSSRSVGPMHHLAEKGGTSEFLSWPPRTFPRRRGNNGAVFPTPEFHLGG
jgi:hypothetical protein